MLVYLLVCIETLRQVCLEAWRGNTLTVGQELGLMDADKLFTECYVFFGWMVGGMPFRDNLQRVRSVRYPDW